MSRSEFGAYFGYLEEYGFVLEELVGLRSLASSIGFCRRCLGTVSDAAPFANWCVGMLEKFLSSWMGYPYREARLVALAEEAETRGLVPFHIASRCQEIGGNPEDAKEAACSALVLLDDVMRLFIASEGFGESLPLSANPAIEPLLLNDTMDRREEGLRGKAALASALSGDGRAKDDAERIVAQVRMRKRESAEMISRAMGLFREIVDFDFTRDGSSRNHCDTEALESEHFDAVEHAIAIEDQCGEALDKFERSIRQILSEHDYIRMLLRGRGSATDRQFEVMAFPRATGGTTRVLQISGGAGTGKTLCLIAKLVMDVRPSEQGSLFPERPKRGLFVCFNKSLAAQTRALIGAMPEARGRIEVIHFDRFVNQLVRFRSTGDCQHLNPFAQNARYPYGWSIVYSDEASIGKAMEQVAAKHPGERGMYYLDGEDPANVAWVKDEIEWLEARYENSQAAVEPYRTQMAERKGRGKQRLPRQDARGIILEIWEEYARLLEAERCYMLPQAVKRLLRVSDLPVYDSIAVDEVQDLSINSLRLLFKMRAGDEARVYLSGDENQKIYQRDFTWKELGEGVRGHTISLSENKRNSPSIEAFANRLLGRTCDHVCASDNVYVLSASAERFERLVRRARAECPGESIAVIGNLAVWDERLGCAGLDVVDPDECGSSKPGLYVLGEKKGKGLEFDTVIIDCAFLGRGDEEEEKRVLYVNCTRARKRLYLRYEGEPPEIIKKYYPDFLGR